MSGLPGRAPSVAPEIGGSNIQNHYSVIPAKVAGQVDSHSYALTEQRENASLPTWETPGVTIPSDGPISSMFLHAPVSSLALFDQPLAQESDTDFGKKTSALVESHELARTTNVPVARDHSAQRRTDAPIQTSISMVSPVVTRNLVECASDEAVMGEPESEFACEYERGASGPAHIPGEPMMSSGDISAHAVDMMGNDPHPMARPRGLPAEEFEGDILKLKGRLLREGAEPAAVGVCTKIFGEGISIAALEVSMTRKESEEHGVIGKRYRMLLERRTELGAIENRCRLCGRKGSFKYKNHRDTLRHLLKDHFGMGYECNYNWYV